MLVSSRKLDALVGAIYAVSDDEAVMVQSFTATGTYPAESLASITVQVVSGVGFGLSGGLAETATIVGVTDAVNSMTVQINLNGAFVANITEYVLGFTSNAIVVGGNNANAIAFLLGADISSLNFDLGILSDAPIAPGQVVTFTNTAANITPSTALTQSDLNGDRKSDLLLQYTDGTIVIWTQSNLGITAGNLIGSPGGAWHVIGSADFNGDGQNDILLENTNGDIVAWLMKGGAVTSGPRLGSTGPTFHIRALADFNGDGKADLLLQHDVDQTMFLFETNGSAITATGSLGTPGPGWTIEGVGDFNGDGQTDILVQNTNGALVDYLMNGLRITASAVLGNPGRGWAVLGTGDYNGDGKTDILLHNDNGQDVIWETNGTSVVNAVNFGNPGPAYTGAVAGVDLNGDGVQDLVLQRNDSALFGFSLDNTAAITASAVLGVPGQGWQAIGDNPTLFIDGTSNTVVLSGTPGADQFDLTTYIPGLHQIFQFDPAQDSVALSAATFPSYAALQTAEQPYNGGTYIQLIPGNALVIQGVTPDQLGPSNFALR